MLAIDWTAYEKFYAADGLAGTDIGPIVEISRSEHPQSSLTALHDIARTIPTHTPHASPQNKGPSPSSLEETDGARPKTTGCSRGNVLRPRHTMNSHSPEVAIEFAADSPSDNKQECY